MYMRMCANVHLKCDQQDEMRLDSNSFSLSILQIEYANLIKQAELLLRKQDIYLKLKTIRSHTRLTNVSPELHHLTWADELH